MARASSPTEVGLLVPFSAPGSQAGLAGVNVNFLANNSKCYLVRIFYFKQNQKDI